MEEELTISEQEIREVEEMVERAGASARISPLDPDFILVLFGAAIPFDIIFGILELLGLLSAWVPISPVTLKIISIILNILAFTIICGWAIWRSQKIIKTREAQKKALQETLAKRGMALEKQLTKALAKRGMKALVRRVLIRGLVAVIGGILPLVAFIPFWTITVILTLREK